MSPTYPHNRLQRVLQARRRGMALTVAFLAAFIVAGMFAPGKAQAAGSHITALYTPPNFPNPPSDLWGGNLLGSGSCAGGLCTGMYWFRADDGGGVSTSGNRVCVGGIRATDTISISANSSGWSDYTPTRANAAMTINGGANVRCWNGSAWVGRGSFNYLPFMGDAGIGEDVLSTVNITSINGGTADYKGNFGFNSTADGTLILAANWAGPQAVTLTASDYHPDKNEVMTFTMSYDAGLLGFTPNHLWFTRDVYDYEHFPIVDSGSVANPKTFSHTFTYAGSFEPVVTLSDCARDETKLGLVFAGGCHYDEGFGSGMTVIDTAPAHYTSKFNASPRDVKVGDPVTFTYTIDSAQCTTHGTPSVAIFHSGENQNFQSGSVVTSLSSFVYRYRQPGLEASGTAYPYIDVVCSGDLADYTAFGDTTFPIWLGNSQLRAEAQAMTVRESTYVKVPPSSADFTNGGASPNFGSGNTFSFYADRFVAKQGEQVNLRYQFFVPFTASGVYLHPDVNVTVNNAESESGATTVGRVNYTAIVYTSPGVKRPYIEVRSNAFNPADPATYRLFYLGGTTNVNLAQSITITNQISSTQSGSFLTSRGVFGLNPATFNVTFGDSDNIFLKFAGDVVTYVLRAGLYVAAFAFHLLEQAPFFSLIYGTLAPTSGTTYSLPAQIGNVTMPTGLYHSTFTISYGDITGGAFVSILQVLIAFGLVITMLKRFH